MWNHTNAFYDWRDRVPCSSQCLIGPPSRLSSRSNFICRNSLLCCQTVIIGCVRYLQGLILGTYACAFRPRRTVGEPWDMHVFRFPRLLSRSRSGQIRSWWFWLLVVVRFSMNETDLSLVVCMYNISYSSRGTLWCVSSRRYISCAVGTCVALLHILFVA